MNKFGVCDLQTYYKVTIISHFSRVQLFVNLWTVAYQVPLSMEFSRQEYWSELPFPPPEHLPNPETEPTPHVSPALADGFFTTSATSAVISCSVKSDSLRPHGLQCARVLCPWDSVGKSTGVDCHALLQGIFPTQGSNPGLLRVLLRRQILYC